MTNSESALIGILLVEPETAFKAASQHGITHEAFDDPFCRAVFFAATVLEQGGQPIDLYSIANSVSQDAFPCARTSLEALFASAPVPAHAGYHAHIVSQSMQAKRLSEHLQHGVDALSKGDTAGSVLAKLETEILDSTYYSLSSPLVPIGQVPTPNHAAETLTWRWPILAAATGPVPIGTNIVLGGRPGYGKTTFALAQALYYATLGKQVVIFSLEMPAYMIRKRIDKFTPNTKAIGTNLLINDRPHTLHRLHGEIRSAIADGAALIVVDFVQKISQGGHGPGRTLARWEHITECSALLSNTIRGSTANLILISQISRAGDEKGTSATLKQSGALEEDADLVLIIQKTGGISVDKNRHGPQGTVVPLSLDQTGTTFVPDPHFAPSRGQQPNGFPSPDSSRKTPDSRSRSPAHPGPAMEIRLPVAGAGTRGRN